MVVKDDSVDLFVATEQIYEGEKKEYDDQKHFTLISDHFCSLYVVS